MKNDKTIRDERRRRLDAFDEILIPHPRLKEIRQRTLDLIDDTEAAIKRNERSGKALRGGVKVKPEELLVLPIIGPSGATKSTSMEEVVAEIGSNPNLEDEEVPVLHVTLDQNTRGPKQLQVQILEKFGDPGADSVAKSVQYSAGVVNESIREIARRRKTRVIVLDEAGNMLTNAGDGVTKNMAKAIKGLVNQGIFSVILMGTEEVRRLFANSELQSRNCGTIDLGAFDIKSKDDRRYFFTFVDDFEKRMLKDGVIDRPLGMVGDVESRATIYDIAGGIIGIVPRILRQAVDRMASNGRGWLDWEEDVGPAFHGWNMAQEPARRHHDPFGESGAKISTLAFVREDTKAKVKKSLEDA